MVNNDTFLQMSESNNSYYLLGNTSSNFNESHGIQNDIGRIFVTFIAALVALSTILGNLLVIIAFRYDQHLQTLSNYYLVSLAVSDFTVGLVSMPFYTVYLLYGYWPLGPTLCDFWLSVDYAMTTASVANLLVISVDRYLSVRQPIRYRAKRTHRKVGLMIAYAWAIALLLWPPWIFAWPSIEGKRTIPFNDCYVQFLRSNSIMTLATSLITFYIPVMITAVLYFLIYKETQLQKKMMSAYRGGSTKQNFVVKDKKKQTVNMGSEDKAMENSELTASGIKLKTNPIVIDNRNSSRDNVAGMRTDEKSLAGLEVGQTRLQGTITLKDNSSTQIAEFNSRVQDVGLATPSFTSLAEFEHSKRKSPSIADHTSAKMRCKPVNVVLPMVVKPSSSTLTGRQDRGFGSTERTANLQTLSINKPSSRQERKILRVLSVILLALIITFAPYYSVVIVEVYCYDCVKSIIHDIAYWLCYINSTINPILYGLCNANFQRAFLNLLRCKPK